MPPIVPCTIHDCVAILYYDGNMIDGDWSELDKVFWAFPHCVEAFGGWDTPYESVLLIVVAQDGNNNILPINFVFVEFETTVMIGFPIEFE
ncbi:hypothetical protein Ahy_A07g030969 [Arachis hypogaea]|uniref:Uncharacterized protein n=1 Tax=Arachis hypogaea TaxID=3818 RepID=A0A445C2I2_ARAHY|nr:hypothetical protein Ahy_A07g030969 [Arachis hypogaea]